MRAIIFDIDHTLFDANHALHAGVADLLAILQRLGVKIGAISNKDHRAFVHLDEAGIRQYFDQVLTAAQTDEPKTPGALHRLLTDLGASAEEATLVSHAHADILLGKDAQVAKTIGISQDLQNVSPLRNAGADHIVSNIPGVLDVLE